MRLVAVLGYSGRRTTGLDPICESRLRHAERLDADAVVLSGRAKHRAGEAELMRAAWRGADVPIVAESTARSTAENAAEVAAVARRLGANEVVVVTSPWHAPRAGLLVRAALRGTGIQVRTSAPPARRAGRLLAREVACTALLPYHLVRAERRRRAG
jgi:uncharacterized SAM-binding protein YcdF (DUF218 family)